MQTRTLTEKKLSTYAIYSDAKNKRNGIYIIDKDNIKSTDFIDFVKSVDVITAAAKHELPSIYTHELSVGPLAGQNTGAVHFMMIDSDDEFAPPRNEVLEILEDLDLSYLAYYTASNYKEDFDKYRIIIPLAEKCDREKYILLKNHDFNFFNINTFYWDKGAIFRSGKMYLPGRIDVKAEIDIRFHIGKYLDISEDIENAVEKAEFIKERDLIYSKVQTNEIDKTATNKQFIKTQNELHDEIGDGFYEKIASYVGKFIVGGVDNESEMISAFACTSFQLKQKHIRNIKTNFKEYFKPENVGLKKLNEISVADLEKIESVTHSNETIFEMDCDYLSDIPGFKELIKKSTDDGKIIFLDAPTNSGKSYVVLEEIEKVLLAVPFRIIVNDLAQKHNIQDVQAGCPPDFSCNKHISTWDGVIKFIPKSQYCKETTLVIDEAHLISESEYRFNTILNLYRSIKVFKSCIIMSGTPEYFGVFDNFEDGAVFIKVIKKNKPVKQVSCYRHTESKKIEIMLKNLIEDDKSIHLVFHNNKTKNRDMADFLINNNREAFCVDADSTNLDPMKNKPKPGTVIFATNYVVCGYRMGYSPDKLHVVYHHHSMSPMSIQQVAERPQRDINHNEQPILDISVYLPTPGNVYWDHAHEIKKNAIDIQEKIDLQNRLSKISNDYLLKILAQDYLDEEEKRMIGCLRFSRRYSYAASKNRNIMKYALERYNCKIEDIDYDDKLMEFEFSKKPKSEVFVEEIKKLKETKTSEVFGITATKPVRFLSFFPVENPQYQAANKCVNILNALLIIMKDFDLVCDVFIATKGKLTKMKQIHRVFKMVAYCPSIYHDIMDYDIEDDPVSFLQQIYWQCNDIDKNEIYDAIIIIVATYYDADAEVDIEANGFMENMKKHYSKKDILKIMSIFFSFEKVCKRNEHGKQIKTQKIVGRTCFKEMTQNQEITDRLFKQLKWRSQNKWTRSTKSTEVLPKSAPQQNAGIASIINELQQIEDYQIQTIFDI